MTSPKEYDTLVRVQEALDWNASETLPVIAADDEAMATLRDLEELRLALRYDEHPVAAVVRPPQPSLSRPLVLHSFFAACALFVILSLLPGPLTGASSVAVPGMVALIMGPISTIALRKAGGL